MTQQTKEGIVQKNIRPWNRRQEGSEYDDDAGEEKIYREPKHVFPSLAAQLPIEFHGNLRIDDKLVRRRHRFEHALLRVDLVLQHDVVIVSRPKTSAHPCD
ncbi:MAG: hypothetical protein DMG15_01295 [Acidobacteria bacterium]|nr:MAG: hypothetical protein DMG15_01295 [Acidobacteriota bacterium]